MKLALVAALALLALPHAAQAEPADQHVYLEATGEMLVGVDGAGHALLNEATYDVTPVDGFHRLRFALNMSPDGLALETPVADGKVRYRFELQLFDAQTGDALLDAPLRYTGPATYAWEAPDERPIRVVLTMTQGALVTYGLRVNALPDPEIVG